MLEVDNGSGHFNDYSMHEGGLAEELVNAD
jgi:hypothetical protein